MTKAKVLTDEVKASVWQLRRKGLTAVAIGAQLGLSKELVRYVFVQHGGIAPRPRRRRRSSLSVAEREEISRGLARVESFRSLARRLGRSPSTISREVHRNGGVARYRALGAEQSAWRRARRPKPLRLVHEPWLKKQVAQKLALDWSPQQIAQWLQSAYPNQPQRHVSHETIYRSLFVQTKGTLKKELKAHLRTRRKIRHAQGKASGGRGRIPDAISIRERPAEVEDRAVPGHWEGDLICGSNNSYIATLVERHTRFVMLVKVPNKTTEAVVAALIDRINQLDAHLKRSLTWDRGSEMKAHKAFTIATDMDVYFCDPASPWQRGTNENTNGLLRQYYPKGMDLTGVTQADLDEKADRLNGRPRQTLGWKNPAHNMRQLLR